ncbi:MAG: trypsin-like serine protease [Anaerolineae bacterium]|nr:trypsin-like serine protease [Anaerolineae bacterium]
MRRFVLLIILGLLSLILIACQGDDNGGDSPNTAVPSGHQAAASADTRPQDLLIAQVATPTLVPQTVIDQLRAEDQVLINLYQRVNPSVVNIEVIQRSGNIRNLSASGSGFIYDNQGHIVTNAHVVQSATEISVTFSDGYVASAEVVGLDEYSDLAVIRIETDPARLLPVELGDSNQLLVGQGVVAIGNPFGLASSMTRGIISALGRALPSATLIDQTNFRISNPSVIQVDAAINPGNSGGPLLNYAGQVIGVNSAIRTESGFFEGVAFAVPVNTLKRVVPQLIENGFAAYSWLGVYTLPDELTVAALAEPLNLPVSYGVLIDGFPPNSPAEAAGLRGGNRSVTFRGQEVTLGGDIIVAINGVFVRDLDDLLAYLVENTAPDDRVTLTVVRDEETLDIPVDLGVRP